MGFTPPLQYSSVFERRPDDGSNDCHGNEAQDKSDQRLEERDHLREEPFLQVMVMLLKNSLRTVNALSTAWRRSPPATLFMACSAYSLHSPCIREIRPPLDRISRLCRDQLRYDVAKDVAEDDAQSRPVDSSVQDVVSHLG